MSKVLSLSLNSEKCLYLLEKTTFEALMVSTSLGSTHGYDVHVCTSPLSMSVNFANKAYG